MKSGGGYSNNSIKDQAPSAIAQSSNVEPEDQPLAGGGVITPSATDDVKAESLRVADNVEVVESDADLPEGLVIGDADKAPESITLVNKNRHDIIVKSVTGDSMVLPPGSHKVPGHFNWNLPYGVSIAKE